MPVFRTFGQCLAALEAYFRYHALRARYEPALDAPVGPAAAPLAAGTVFSERQAKEVLAAYGVSVPREVVATSADEAVRAAAAMGGPVVMKVASADIVHKSDLGLVRVGVPAAEVAAVYEELTARAAAVPAAAVDGVLVAEQVPAGVEMVLGVVRDAVFGPAVMVGLGGVLLEVLHDVAFRVPPFPEAEARAMLDELRGRAVLDGVRSAPAADVDALVAAIMAVQRLVLDHADTIAELDVNPLIVGARGTGADAVDAFLRTL